MPRHRDKPAGLPILNDRAAGIDIGARFHVAAIPIDRCDEPVQTFQSFTADLERMAEWLVSMGIETVAMESTGVYWIPAYEILSGRGLKVIVANARESRAHEPATPSCGGRHHRGNRNEDHPGHRQW